MVSWEWSEIKKIIIKEEKMQSRVVSIRIPLLEAIVMDPD